MKLNSRTQWYVGSAAIEFHLLSLARFRDHRAEKFPQCIFIFQRFCHANDPQLLTERACKEHPISTLIHAFDLVFEN